MNAKKSKGFSLLEMLVVVAMIGVLASFAIPTYQDYLHKVREFAGAE